MNQKVVYQTNYAGLFVNETLADESPLEPGNFLIPAGCVELPPPEEWPEDKWPRWNGIDWDLIPKPDLAEPKTAAEKLAEFLQNNPDVQSLINKDTNL